MVMGDAWLPVAEASEVLICYALSAQMGRQVTAVADPSLSGIALGGDREECRSRTSCATVALAILSWRRTS
jgi:hypothetical protein